jgi:hypothetical protein
MLQVTVIFDGQGQTAKCHSTEDWLHHHIDVETEDHLWR